MYGNGRNFRRSAFFYTLDRSQYASLLNHRHFVVPGNRDFLLPEHTHLL